MADGMRIQKVVDIATAVPEDDSGSWDENLAANKPTTRYYHDGQSVFEEDFTRYEGGTALKTDVLRHALGARGIERIAWRPDGGSWGFKYPLYDLHGSMVATLHRGTGGAYTLGDVKTYDAWGGVRSGSGGPTQRYCASLGHIQDDESSLIYMRARYYEPWTGRFVSEDPARDGGNWFVYAASDPVGKVDATGKNAVDGCIYGMLIGFFGSLLVSWFDGEAIGVGTLIGATRDTALGAAAGLAADFVNNFLKAKLPRTPRPVRLGASVTSGLGTIVAMYYGIRAGQVLFELFEMGLEDSYEVFGNDDRFTGQVR